MRVLWIGAAPAAEAPFETLLREMDPETEVETGPCSPVILDQIAGGAFDGVICRADGPEALDVISRIRGRNPGVPLVVVTSNADPGFESRALAVGASLVAAEDAGSVLHAENLRRFLNLTAAGRDLQESIEASKRLRRELTEVIFERKSASQARARISRRWLQRKLLPLLVENDAEEAFQMVRAFEKAEVFAPLPTLTSPDEAIRYLQGGPPYENRHVYPLPNTILLDLSPMALNIQVLQWVRLQPSLASTPVILLGSGDPVCEVVQAHGHLANSVLLKPPAFEDLVTLVRAIDAYWTRMNVGGI